MLGHDAGNGFPMQGDRDFFPLLHLLEVIWQMPAQFGDIDLGHDESCSVQIFCIFWGWRDE